MTTKDASASAPDVLTSVKPALSSTSDMPGDAAAVVVAAPPTSAIGGKAPDAVAEPAKSPEGGDKTPPADAKPDGADAAKPVDGDAKPADKKPKDGINERFSKLTADRKAAEEKAAAEETARKAAEARADGLSQDLKAINDRLDKIIPPAPEDVRPERAKFDDPTKYDEALIAWSARAAEKKAKAEAEAGFQAKTEAEKKASDEAAAKARADRVASDYAARAAEFTKEAADYDEVIRRDDVQITPTMGMAIMTRELGPKLAYHLGNNPEEAAKIAALSPADQLIAMGRLEVKLEAPPKTTTTPDPITPLAAGRASATPKSPDAESMEEYAARRSPQLRAAPANGRART